MEKLIVLSVFAYNPISECIAILRARKGMRLIRELRMGLENVEYSFDAVDIM
jgi:hypothetical protein